MDFTNSKDKKFNTTFLNGQLVNYLFFSAFAPFLYFALSKLVMNFSDSLVSRIVGAIGTAAYLFFVYHKYIFIKSNKNIVWRVTTFLLECAIDFGLFYLFTVVLQPVVGVDILVCGTVSLFFILLFNYYFSDLVVFQGHVPAKKRKNGRLLHLSYSNRFVLLSGACAAFILLFVYFCYNAYPFGDMTVLRMDLYHQYGPLFGELYDRVADGQSFLYSWQSGGGSSFLGNFFNYLSSPLNFLALLFERNQVTGAISMIILLKAVLAAASFTLYLKLSYKRTSYLTAGFGLLYAFCGFFLAYYWNVMWIDALYLLPMLLYGIESMIRRGKFKLYFLSLILMMVSNYYMSFIACIFSVLYFVTYYFSHYNFDASIVPHKIATKHRFNLRNSRLLRAGGLFALTSIIAGAVCAVVLLPTYQALQASSATTGVFPKELTTYFNLFDFLSNHLAGIETTIRSSGGDVLPNVYSGLLVLILIPLYMMNQSIRLREKVMHVLLLVVLVMSFNTNMLNYIWHAFHFPNDLPYRFSFLYTFVLLTMSFKLLTKFKSIQYRDIILVGMLLLLFVALSEKMPNKYLKDNITVYVTIAFTLVYVCILTMIKKKSVGASFLSLLLLLAIGTELVVGSTDSYLISQKYDDYAGDYDTYQTTLDKIDSYEQGSADLPRTEQFHLRARMDPCWYGYRGISTFSSMAYDKASHLQFNLGMFGNRINSYTYNPQTPIYNAMFALKYFIGTDKNSVPNEDYYETLFSEQEEDTTVYRNKYYLPLAFCVDNTIKNWAPIEGDPFVAQSDFLQSATGVSDVFVPVDITGRNSVNMQSYTFGGNAVFNYSKYTEENASVGFTMTTRENGNVYLYATSPDTKKAEISSEKVTLSYDFDTSYVLDLGYHDAGDDIDITFTIGDAKTSTLGLYCYTMDSERFENAYDYLNSSTYQLTESSDTHLNGTVTARADCVLYTSIPYDKGWQVFVDGKKEETITIGDSLIGVNLTAGKHEVSFKYVPAGLRLGAGISITTLALIAAYSGMTKLRIGRKKEEETDETSPI